MADENQPSGEPEIEILSSTAEKFDSSGNPLETAAAPSQEASAMAEAPPADSDVKAMLEETKEKLIWLAAEFDNYKKRVLKEREDDRKFSQAGLLKDFLGVADNLERAVSAMPEGALEGPAQGLKTGVELTLRSFQALLAKQGVTRIGAKGERFNPRLHEVMFEEKTDAVPDDTVMEELQAGYMIQERVLRPAMVKVARNVTKTS